MSQEYARFFNSAEGDVRSYEADDMAAAFAAICTSGVASLNNSCLKIRAEGGTMRTLAAYGKAVIKGYHYELRDDGGGVMAITHTVPTGVDRIDRIVLRLNLTARSISMLKREGTASASPTPPSLTRNATTYDISLAQVRVRNGATAIAESDITDERGDESVCGAAVPDALKLSALWSKLTKPNATTSAAGLMSSTDKSRLNALVSALSVSSTAINVGGRYIDNALFR